MNIRTFRNYLFLMVSLTVCATDVFGQTCPVGMQGALSKTLYEVDEPIDLALTFENQDHAERRVLISSPALSAASTNLVSLLTLTPTGVLKQAPRDGVTASMSMMGRRISGGGKATVRVFLQRYLDGLVPGHYEIPWEFQASCVDDKLTPAGFVSGRGLIRLDIVAARGALPTIFEQYIQKVRSASDATTRNEAAEALVSSRSPEVIPYLKQVAALGEVTVAFNGLIKFKGNSLAREFVLEGLQSGKTTEETDSLRVLIEWRERLSNAELERLLQNNRTRSAVLHYIGLIQDTDRLPLVEQYTDNPDPNVAKVAREARTALLNQGSVRRGGRGADQKP